MEAERPQVALGTHCIAKVLNWADVKPDHEENISRTSVAACPVPFGVGGASPRARNVKILKIIDKKGSNMKQEQ